MKPSPDNQQFFTYVIELNEGKYYIGCSNHIHRRMTQHKNRSKSSAKWVIKYGFKNLIEIVEGDMKMEKIKTIEYAKKYGWENVRGYVWQKGIPSQKIIHTL